jgi:hypothetical protein
MQLTVISTMKNEGPFILDWLAHYRVLGFDSFVICWNDCDDGTDRMLIRLEELGLITQHPTVIRKGGIHRSALRQARRKAAVQEADWVLICDVDEYLNVHVGDHTVHAMLEASGEADCITVPWRIFGSGGVEAYEDRPVPDQFLRAEPPWDAETNPLTGKFVKSLFRDQSRFGRLGLHEPVAPEDADPPLRFVYPGGKPKAEGGPSFEIAQMNHYMLRSLDSYLVKRDRGRANHMKHVLGLDYWKKWNRNAAYDDTIRRYRAATDAMVEELKADPLLGPLHDAAVAWHIAKVAEMRLRPEVQEILPEMQATLYGEDSPEPVEIRSLEAAATG